MNIKCPECYHRVGGEEKGEMFVLSKQCKVKLLFLSFQLNIFWYSWKPNFIFGKSKLLFYPKNW